MIELFPYQRQGAAWLATKHHAYLADEMRLGKSAQAISAADMVRADSILVLCPAVARINWTREFQSFSQRFRTITPVLSAEMASTQSDVVVTSYELAHLLPPRRWDLVIPDEAHYLKSLDAARTACVLGRDGLLHSADRTWFLSGTPTPNNPSELWAVLYVCGITKLPYDAFVARYCKGYATPYGFKITGGQNLAELRAAFEGTFLLRRTKAQVRPDMPQILVTPLVVEPGPVDIEANFLPQWLAGGDRAVLNSVAVEEGKVRNAWRAGEFAALEAIADNTPVYRRFVGLQKVAPVAELVRAQLEADPAMKIVLFAWHQAVIEGLRQALAPFGAVTLYGKTPDAKRQKNIDAFNDPKSKVRVFVGNLLAAGTAIPLTGAHHGLVVEDDWVPGNIAQAIMRMDGPLQREQITVQIVSVAGTIDDDIARAKLVKVRMQAELFS